MRSTIDILFDFDGTLVDSSEGIIESLRSACINCGFDINNREDIVNYIGPPIGELVKNLVPEITEDKMNSITQSFRSEYDNKGIYNYKIYPKLREVLTEFLYKKKLKLGILTNKPTLLARKIIELEGLEKYFELIVGIDYQLITKKGDIFTSKKEALAKLIDIGVVNHNCVYIGDTLGDKIACESLNIDFIAARYGFYKWPISELPKKFINKLEDLLVANTL